MGFKMIYWTPMSGSYFLMGSILEKCRKFWKNGRFSGRIWPDWGNTTRADMPGLGSIGLSIIQTRCRHCIAVSCSIGKTKHNHLEYSLDAPLCHVSLYLLCRTAFSLNTHTSYHAISSNDKFSTYIRFHAKSIRNANVL